MKTSTEFCSTWPIGVLSLLVVKDFISSNLALPHFVTEQRVAPSGEIRVLQNIGTIKNLFQWECMLIIVCLCCLYVDM